MYESQGTYVELTRASAGSSIISPNTTYMIVLLYCLITRAYDTQDGYLVGIVFAHRLSTLYRLLLFPINN